MQRDKKELINNKFLRWIQNVALGIDETVNAVTGGDGEETISSRAAKAQVAGKKWGCVLCKILDLFQKDHCKISLNTAVGDNAVIPDDKG